jgi:hypothetical protein
MEENEILNSAASPVISLSPKWIKLDQRQGTPQIYASPLWGTRGYKGGL